MPQESAATPSGALKPLSLIVACSSDGGIGKGGQLPWRIPGDMAYFKRVTAETTAPEKQNAVIMGRKTWESIPAKFRPLAGRVNVVLSRTPASLDLPSDVLGAASLPDALAAVDNRADIDQCFIIGGAEIYKQAWNMDRLTKVCPMFATCPRVLRMLPSLHVSPRPLCGDTVVYSLSCWVAGVPDARTWHSRVRRFHSC